MEPPALKVVAIRALNYLPGLGLQEEETETLPELINKASLREGGLLLGIEKLRKLGKGSRVIAKER